MPKTKSNPITFGTCLAEFKNSRFPRDFAGRGLVVVEDNSNDAEGHVAKMLERVGDEAKTYGYDFSNLKNPSQWVAKSYEATNRPALFLHDRDCKLVYHGQFDDARLGSKPSCFLTAG
ncbi:hypothetical protein [Brucella pituitosa]|uniref:Uncharacterized protein n=1 Tax=Brucella pituitosa TaxID=571256 RepID=A0A643EVB1_9HYPH|nr:hypothetical protein [Brucella pituitosa]KAB0567757.1 hypothetical protein F7Q93_20415 [Brucella pituitosa]